MAPMANSGRVNARYLRLIGETAGEVLSRRRELEMSGELVAGDYRTFASHVSRLVNLRHEGVQMRPEALLSVYKPAFVPFLARFLGDSARARKAVWQRGSVRKPAETGEDVVRATKHAVFENTRKRARQLLAAAKAVEGEHPKGFASARDFIRAVIATAAERFGLDFRPDVSYIRSSPTYWPVVEPYCLISSPEPAVREVTGRPLPDLKTALLDLKACTLPDPKTTPLHEIVKAGFSSCKVSPPVLTTHLMRLAGGKGRLARELKSLILRFANKREAIGVRFIAKARLKLTHLFRKKFRREQTHEIVSSCRGGNAELKFLIEIATAGFLPAARRRFIDDQTGDYLVYYNFSRAGENFFVLYADTSVDYSAVNPKIPREEGRRERIRRLARDKTLFSGTRWVVFSDKGWSGKWSSAEMIRQIERGKRMGSGKLKVLDKIAAELEEVVAGIPVVGLGSKDIHRQMMLLKTAIHLARSETDAGRRKARIEEAMREAARIGADIRTMKKTVGGGTSSGAGFKAPVHHRLPLDAMAVVGGGLVFPACVPFATLAPPFAMRAGFMVW